jgi:hypothetical protein
MTLVRTSAPVTAALYSPADTTDAQLVELWLHDKAAHTQRADRADVERFVASVARSLRSVTLADLQAFADSVIKSRVHVQFTESTTMTRHGCSALKPTGRGAAAAG